ncbi:MAG: DUF2553 family protein [Bacillaceae bacterium]|nr:DUF2553 family protein [Bacillaceae bacterium]
MTERHAKDVTRRVYGTFEDGETMNLFVGKEKIGQLIITEEGKEYHLKDGYTYEQKRFLRYDEEMDPVTQYVSDCDLGWC